MKQVSVCSLFLLFIISSFTQHNHKTNIRQHFDDWRDNWLLTDDQATNMQQWLNDCPPAGQRKHQKFYPDMHNVMGLIRRNYKINWLQWVNARYSDNDVDRYRKARGIAPNDPHGDVSGYTTRILLINVDEDRLTSYNLYFDIGTICPPPDNPPCN